MSEAQIYPADPMDSKRPQFEAEILRVAVEKLGYSKTDALLKTLVERNRNGLYAVELVRGAWIGYGLNQVGQEAAPAS